MPSAVDRYVGEVRRVSGVLDKVLKEREWLVGGRFSYVDAAFLPWYEIVIFMFAERVRLKEEFPSLSAWLGRIRARPAIQASIGARQKMLEGD